MGQSEGRAEKRGHRALLAFPHFFHGSHSVGWTLQQADNIEERGNEDLHGEKSRPDQGIREKSKPKQPERRKCQRPGKMCKKEGNQSKSDSKL